MLTARRWVVLIALACTATTCAEQTSYHIVVEAGPYDRFGTLTSVVVPAGLAAESFALIDLRGTAVPAQLANDGRLWFVVDSLRAGETATFEVRPRIPGRAPAAISARRDTEGVTFLAGDSLILRYQHLTAPLPRTDIDARFERGGYLHPVQTPAGRLVTDDYPPNHLHHHGIWSAWTSTRFQGRTPDFWNMGDATGTVLPVSLDSAWSGGVIAGFVARHRFVDLSAPSPVDALEEQWTVHVLPPRAEGYTFDLDVQQWALADTLFLPEYRYGGIGFRGHRSWDGAPNAIFLTSEGGDRSDGHATTARWCYVGGVVDGAQAGVAILGHVDNFRAPQPMRIHPTEPFFNFAPTQAGPFAIVPGQPYRARYRYVAFDGPPDTSHLDRMWHDFSFPPVATIVRP